MLLCTGYGTWGPCVFGFGQLNAAREKGLAFSGLSESTIAFAPTYKYDNGTNLYDTR